MPLYLAFVFGMLGCFSGAMLSELPVMAFSPFLAMAALRLDLLKTLWLALLCGLCLDLLASGTRLGLYTISYMIAVLALYRFRKHIFEDKIVTFALYSAAISSLTTFIVALASRLEWNFSFIAVDLVLLPCLDGLVGYLLLVFPYRVFIYTRRWTRLRMMIMRKT